MDEDSDISDIQRINAVLGSGADFLETDDREQSDGQSVISSYQQYLTPGGTTPFSGRSSVAASSRRTGMILGEAVVGEPDVDIAPDTSVVLSNIPLCLENCLALNQAYQAVLEDTIQQLSGLLTTNLEKQSALQIEIEHSSQKSASAKPEKQKLKILPLSAFGTPYFKDAENKPCPSNLDTALVKQLGGTNLYLKLQKIPSWDRKQDGKLLRAVQDEAFEKETKRLFTTREELKTKLPLIPEDERNGLEKQIKELTLSLYNIEKSFETTNMVLEREDYNWKKISSVAFNGKRSEDELRLYWKNYLHPAINKSFWTTAERKKLTGLVVEGKDVDWDEIARELGTSRTALQCFSYFQTQLNKNHGKRVWNQKENLQLRKEFQKSPKFNWEEIAHLFPGKSKESVNDRWNRLAKHPKLVKPFSKTDDYILIECVKSGLEFKEIAILLRDKVETAIRKRYFTIVKRGEVGVLPKFTPEEDARIHELCIEKNHKAFQMRDKFPGRTEAQVATRYQILKLKYKDPEMYKKIMTSSNRNEGQRNVSRLRYRISNIVSQLTNVGVSAPGEESKNALQRAKMVLGKIKNKRKPERNKRRTKTAENLLKDYIGPYCPVYRGRTRKTLFPGDVRDHALNFCALSRALYVKFPQKPEEITEDCAGLEKYLELSQLGPWQDPKEGPVSSLPPNLCTLTGFRGLLLHRRYLNTMSEQDQVAQDPSESGTSTTPSHAAEGNAEADHLLLARFLGMFFWPAVMSTISAPESLQQQAKEGEAEQQPPVAAEVDEGEEENLPKKKKLSRKQYGKLRAQHAREAHKKKLEEQNKQSGTS